MRHSADKNLRMVTFNSPALSAPATPYCFNIGASGMIDWTVPLPKVDESPTMSARP